MNRFDIIGTIEFCYGFLEHRPHIFLMRLPILLLVRILIYDIGQGVAFAVASLAQTI